MNKCERISLCVAILACAFFFLSFRWPVEKGRVTSSFGESRGDHFHDGVDMVCPDNKIYPVEKGSLVYYWDSSVFPLDPVPGGGNYKVLEHEGGTYSIYMHLKAGTAGATSYKKTESLGTIGNSGHSFASHLHFSILKKAERVSVNPMKLLPPRKDEKGPAIKGFLLRIDDKYVKLRNNSEIRLTRHYPLLIKMTDTITGRERLGVYRLRVSHNGREIFSVQFNSLLYSEGGLQVEKKAFQDVFDEKGYYKISGITYKEGKNTFRVKALDFAGNSIEKDFTCRVNLDMK